MGDPCVLYQFSEKCFHTIVKSRAVCPAGLKWELCRVKEDLSPMG